MRPDDKTPPRPIHGHTGPTTPAEDGSREAEPGAVSPADMARIAEEASRAEDA
ncbi:MAG TPA: hypothetical protein VFW47_14010 [Phenylobacterium sp.]|nr:hypothetical protein [Phenylobacterium sp.]